MRFMDGFFVFTAVSNNLCQFHNNINNLFKNITFFNINLDNFNIKYYYS